MDLSPSFAPLPYEQPHPVVAAVSSMDIKKSFHSFASASAHLGQDNESFENTFI